MGLLGAMMQREQHERIRFLNWASLIFMVVLIMWLLVGFIWKTNVWVAGAASALILGTYCLYGLWILIARKSKDAFMNFDVRERAFWVFATVVFLFPITDASSYSLPVEVTMFHYGGFSVIYWLRVMYVSRFERDHSAWLLRQTTLGTIWLLDVPSIPAVVVYLCVGIWAVYKLISSEERRVEEKTDTQSKEPALKPPVEKAAPEPTTKPRRSGKIRWDDLGVARPRKEKDDPPTREAPPAPSRETREIREAIADFV
jgi:hypothetical protein